MMNPWLNPSFMPSGDLYWTVFHRQEPGNLPDHGLHGGKTFLDLDLGNACLELEYPEVSGHHS